MSLNLTLKYNKGGINMISSQPLQTIPIQKNKPSRIKIFLRTLLNQRVLVLMILPAFLIIFIFNYIPMYGVLIAFKNYKVAYGIWDSPWVGLKYFEAFFSNPLAVRTVINTLILGVYSFLWTFPAPIILSLLINEISNMKFKKLVQTISYLPYFISIVILVGMMKNFSAMDGGLFNRIVIFFGGKPIQFFAESSWFRTLYIGSSIWQGIGWGTIIYLAALAGIDLALYEAATMDGANRFQRMWHVTFPALLPTICILMILSVGNILGSDFQKVLLMYTPKTYEVSDVISTYVFREGIQGAKFSYTTAVGLFTSVISFILLFTSNKVSKLIGETSLW